MTITLRPMQPNDIPFIVEWMLTIPLWQRYKLQAERTAANFQRGIERGDLLWVADSDGLAYGFAWCILDGMFGFCPYLKLIGVHPDYHSRNIGGQLLTHIEGLAAAQGHHHFFLLVSDFNEMGQRFYQRQGYQPIGAVPHLVLPDVAELVFWKSL
jgi:GNAT superfamily N-acetyltransferase